MIIEIARQNLGLCINELDTSIWHRQDDDRYFGDIRRWLLSITAQI